MTGYALLQPGGPDAMNEDYLTKFHLDPQHVPTLTPEQRARLQAVTDEDLHAAARTDPDNPP